MEKTPQKLLSIVGIGTILSLVYSAFNYAIQILLVELFSYRLRGIFEILMSILGLASILFSFNLYTAINLHVSKHSAVPANLVKVGTGILLVQVVAIAILYVLSPKHGIVPEHLQALFLGLLIAAAVLNHKVNEFTAVLNGSHHFLNAKILSLVGAAFSALLVLFAYLLGHTDVNLIVWLAVIGPFAGSYLYAKLLTWKIPALTQRAGRLNMKGLYKENGAVYIISLAQFISIKLYLLYIAKNESVEMLGIFSLAYSITQFVLLPATLLATIILSNRSDRLGGFFRAFKLLVGYGLLSCAIAKIMIDAGLLDYVPLKSLRNPVFVDILGAMVLAIPFSVLNILIVAVAIKKNLCSRLFVAGQLLMIPLMPLAYVFMAKVMLVASPVASGYVITWIISSIFSCIALHADLRRTGIADQ